MVNLFHIIVSSSEVYIDTTPPHSSQRFHKITVAYTNESVLSVNVNTKQPRQNWQDPELFRKKRLHLFTVQACVFSRPPKTSVERDERTNAYKVSCSA